MLLDCVYILEHHPNLFLANFWALNCVGNFTRSTLFEPELDLNLWSSPRFRHLLNRTIGPVPGSWKSSKNQTELDFSNTTHKEQQLKIFGCVQEKHKKVVPHKDEWNKKKGCFVGEAQESSAAQRAVVKKFWLWVGEAQESGAMQRGVIKKFLGCGRSMKKGCHTRKLHLGKWGLNRETGWLCRLNIWLIFKKQSTIVGGTHW